MIEQPLHLVAVVVISAACAMQLEQRVRALGKVGSAMLAIIFGALLSNAGLVPAGSPVYDQVTGAVTSLAIAWLLIAVDLRDVAKAGPKMLAAFGIAVAGTAAGALVATLVYQGSFPGDAWRLAAAMTGTYSGGSLNFVSVAREVGLEGDVFSAAVAADNVVTGLWLAATLILSVSLARFYPAVSAPQPRASGGEDGRTPASESEHHPHFRRAPLSAARIGLLLGVGFALVAGADLIAALAGALTGWDGLPSIVVLTGLALLAGHARPFRGEAPGAMQLGAFALNCFFVIIGVLSKFSEIADVGIEVFFFAALVVLIHGICVFAAGRLFSLDIGTLAVASQASVGGPASALAVATSRQWRHLVVPGVAVGLLGYAVGTFLGLGAGRVAALLAAGG